MNANAHGMTTPTLVCLLIIASLCLACSSYYAFVIVPPAAALSGPGIVPDLYPVWYASRVALFHHQDPYSPRGDPPDSERHVSGQTGKPERAEIRLSALRGLAFRALCRPPICCRAILFLCAFSAADRVVGSGLARQFNSADHRGRLRDPGAGQFSGHARTRATAAHNAGGGSVSRNRILPALWATGVRRSDGGPGHSQTSASHWSSPAPALLVCFRLAQAQTLSAVTGVDDGRSAGGRGVLEPWLAAALAGDDPRLQPLCGRPASDSDVTWKSSTCAGGSASDRGSVCRKLEMENKRPAACLRLFHFSVPGAVAIPALQRSNADTGGAVGLYPKIQADGNSSEPASLVGMGVAGSWMVEHVCRMRGPPASTRYRLRSVWSLPIVIAWVFPIAVLAYLGVMREC